MKVSFLVFYNEQLPDEDITRVTAGYPLDVMQLDETHQNF